jgi:hypothetical protein
MVLHYFDEVKASWKKDFEPFGAAFYGYYLHSVAGPDSFLSLEGWIFIPGLSLSNFVHETNRKTKLRLEVLN